MRILLDECVPAPIHRQLTNHACSTVHERGWGGIKNGDLLQRAEGEFDLTAASHKHTGTEAYEIVFVEFRPEPRQLSFSCFCYSHFTA